MQFLVDQDFNAKYLEAEHDHHLHYLRGRD
jgi:hypothetical protein